MQFLNGEEAAHMENGEGRDGVGLQDVLGTGVTFLGGDLEE